MLSVLKGMLFLHVQYQSGLYFVHLRHTIKCFDSWQIFSQHHSWLSVKILNKEDIGENYRLPFGLWFWFTIVWGCARKSSLESPLIDFKTLDTRLDLISGFDGTWRLNESFVLSFGNTNLYVTLFRLCTL